MKISSTYVNPSICEENLLSDKLLSILDISDSDGDKIQKTKDLCTQISTRATEIIHKIMEGLAKNHIQKSMIASNHTNFENCVRQMKKLHSRNVRDMTAQILERVFMSHAEA